MSWFWLALAAAFFLATGDYLTKRHFSDLPVGQLILVRLTGLAPVCLVVLLLAPMPAIQPSFYWAAGLALPAEVCALFLYLRAIQVSPLALTMPFAHSGDSGHLIRLKAATRSGALRPLGRSVATLVF